MKVLLTTLNSKYIHSSLALRYLEKFCKKYKKSNYQIELKEFSINEHLDQIMAEIYKTQAEIIAFSTYIWNKNQVFELADRLKKIRPELIIIMGGPEVSFASTDIMEKNRFIDIIIKGEGEETLRELLDCITTAKADLKEIKGLYFRDENRLKIENQQIYESKIIETKERELLMDLDLIPRPYTVSDLKKLSNKIIYYEASRGCPFNCTYCLSSKLKGVRSFSIERIKEDLLFFIDNEIEQIKFVDRSFNADKKKAYEILRFLIENQRKTSFHFEIVADLLEKDTLELLQTAPQGLFQFEIGVQSTNQKSLKLINRQMDFEKLAKNVQKLREYDNINLHLDLIAGLPAEDYSSFKKSFNQVYVLNAHVLQLGFLKLLKGSEVREKAEKYNYQFTSMPPYEVLSNKNISYAELLKLKGVEDILEKYHNSGVFEKSLKFSLYQYQNQFYNFFADFSLYFEENNLHRRSHSRKALYDIFYGFYKSNIKRDLHIFTEFLKFDFVYNNPNAKLPVWAEDIRFKDLNDWRAKFLAERKNLENYLPEYQDENIREILKKVRFEGFAFDVVNKLAKSNLDYAWTKKEIEKLQMEDTIVIIDYGEENNKKKIYSLGK